MTETSLATRDDGEQFADEIHDCDRLTITLEAAEFREDLYKFLLAAWPIVEPSQKFVETWHVRALCRLLQDIVTGREECKRWIINVPPGTLKSLLINVIFPAWVWARDGSKRFLTASYGQSLTIRDNLRVRDIVESRWYQDRFPLKLNEEQNTKIRYNTEKGGWRIATSVGGAGIGEHPDFINIDDAATAQQAESDAERKTVQDWFDRTISPRGITRRNLVVFVVGQRLHMEDLPGYLMKRGGWGKVCFPMRYVPTRPAKDDDMGYTADPRDERTEAGALLAPALIAEDRVKQLEIDLGEYGAAGQLQQAPAPEGGGKFKREWFTYVDAAPKVARRVRGWDTAATEGDGDYTVGARISEADGIYYVEDVVRGQWGPAAVESNMLGTARADGVKVPQREEREGGGAGKTVIAAHVILFAGFDYKGVTVSGMSKVARSNPFRAQAEAGNVRIVRDRGQGGAEGKGWNEDYLRELCTFPTGNHDDQVDASSAAFNAVLLEPKPKKEFAVW
jgi:predicted phage terminase large subunit-like protein